MIYVVHLFTLDLVESVLMNMKKYVFCYKAKKKGSSSYSFETSTVQINFPSLWFNFSPFHSANHIQFPKVMRIPLMDLQFKIVHKFSIGLKSGDCLGHARPS